jgi:type II secretion system protein L
MAKRTLGIDIQRDGLAWVIIRAGLRQTEIEASGWLPYPDNPDPDAGLSAALRILKQKHNPSGLACVAAVTGQDIVCRTFQAPFRDRKKISQMLPLELEPTLLAPVEELVIDFQITGQHTPTPVLAMAMDRSRRDGYLAVLREAGFDPELMTLQGLPSAFLLARSLRDDAAVLLVDGDRENSLFFMIAQGQIIFVRNWTLPRSGAAPEAALGVGIRRTLAALSAQTQPPAELPSVVLTPRTAAAYQEQDLADILDMSVHVLNLRTVMSAPVAGPWPDDRCQDALALCLYAPAAHQGFNFFRTTFPLKKFILQNKRHFVRIAAMGILLIGLLMTDVGLDIRRGRAQLDTLNAAARDILTTTFPDTRNVVDPMQQMVVNLRRTRGQASGYAGHHSIYRKIDILNEVSRALPTGLDIQLSQLVAGRDQLQLTGTTDTFEAVNQAKTMLEKKAMFQTLTIVSANMDPATERVRFKLSADYQTP